MPPNAYEDLSPRDKLIFGHETRLESGQVTADVVFHPSIEMSPTQLSDPKYMFTFADLQQKYGPYWVPTFSTLNDFEAYCKDHWGDISVCLIDSLSDALQPDNCFDSPHRVPMASWAEFPCSKTLEICLNNVSNFGIRQWPWRSAGCFGI